MQERIVFIGGGNMAASLIGGLLTDGTAPELLRVVEPLAARREWLTRQLGVQCDAESVDMVRDADLLVLAVKPQVMAQVATALAQQLPERKPLVVSIAAGIRTDALRQWFGAGIPLIRTMPNTPALIRCGATALYAGPDVSAAQRTSAERLMRAVGLTLWVEKETELDAVTALSGSGPAYFFMFMEALQRAGEQLGLAPDTARLLTLQTALGAARMALESNEAPAELRVRVTSKGGTTEAALGQFRSGGFDHMVSTALRAAAERSRSLADEFGGTAR